MQKLPEAPDRKWGNTCTKKEPSLRKGEICSHFSGTFQTERTFFHPAAPKVARMFAESPGLCMQVLSATC